MTMNIAGMAGAAGVHAWSGASWSAPPQQKMSNLFNAVNASGSGSITKAQFEQGFQTLNPPAVFQQQGADAIFAKLDPTGSGSVSQQDFVKTMTGLIASLRAPAATTPAPAAAPSPAQTLESSLQSFSALAAGATSESSAAGSQVNLKA